MVAVIGYLPVRAETDEAGPAAASATIGHHHQAALSVTCCHSPARRGTTRCAGKRSKSPIIYWHVLSNSSIEKRADYLL